MWYMLDMQSIDKVVQQIKGMFDFCIEHQTKMNQTEQQLQQKNATQPKQSEIKCQACLTGEMNPPSKCHQNGMKERRWN